MIKNKKSSQKKQFSRKSSKYIKILGILSIILFLITLFLGYVLYLKSVEEQAVLNDSHNLKSYLTDLDTKLQICQGNLSIINTNFNQFKKNLEEKSTSALP